MSYCLKFESIIAFVDKGQLQCANVRVKLSGTDSLDLFNFNAYVNKLVADRILLKQESDRDLLPTLLYREKAEVIEGTGSVLNRIQNQAKEKGISCRVICKLSDTAASVFFLNISSIYCQNLVTDKVELYGKTLLIGADSDVDYVGKNIVPIQTDEDFNVDDSVLGNLIYSLSDNRATMEVLVKASV